MPEELHNKKFEEQVIRPEHAQEVGLATVQQQLTNFTEQPSVFAFESIVTKLVEEAYPGRNPNHCVRLLDLNDDRLPESVLFPVFPLSKMGEMELILADMVSGFALPESKHSFLPGAQLLRLVARSDSAYAHSVLAKHLAMPFNTERSKAVDGPNEFEYKSYALDYLFRVVDEIGSPDSNPHVIDTIGTIYGAIREGGTAYKQQLSKEAARPDLFHGISTGELRELQEQILARCIESPHTAFDGIVQEALKEPVDERRALTVIECFAARRFTNYTDNVHGQVIEHVVGQYSQEAAEIIKSITQLECGWLEQPARGLCKELNRTIIFAEKQRSGGPNKRLLEFAFAVYPLTSNLVAKNEHGQLDWATDENYEDDLAYVLGLLHDPSMREAQPLITEVLISNLVRYHNSMSTGSKPEIAKRIYITALEGVLSRTASDYAELLERPATYSILQNLSFLMSTVPEALANASSQELATLFEFWQAYQAYLRRARAPKGYDSAAFADTFGPLIDAIIKKESS